MRLDEQIEADLKTAMKARQTDTVATLRMALAAIKNLRVAPGRSGALTDEETVDLLTREAKKRTEAAAAYEEAGRDELARKERSELAVLQRYLPQQLDDTQLARVVDEAIATVAADSGTDPATLGPGDLGRVMGAVMPRVKGRADGRRVNAVVRDRLR